MNTAKELEKVVASLPQAELDAFRTWFADFEFERWDARLEMDASAGRLDGLGDAALKHHRAGRSKPM
ncbi:hypothetical protein [Candidatus Spongiihabitans sp.]|uniref:hypothetical protein n=1 Tax=Candidatus Spongiihabitans sp. TaxID=3101308 RepID=UPI003C799F59